MPDVTQYFPISNPTLIFFVVLCIILFAPIIMGKLRIPHIVGMVLAGVIVGEYGLNILERDDSFELFGKVGMYYIMFLAGLEMDMESMRKSKNHFIIFGLLTALVPFVITYFIALWLMGYTHPAAFLLGCIMASNTLVAYPIVCRYGLQQHPASALSVGSTMIALTISLTAIAALAAKFTGGGGVGFWLVFIMKITVFCLVLILLIPRATRWFLHRYSDAVMQFIFVLAVMFLSAAMAELANLEGILGAFLSGRITFVFTTICFEARSVIRVEMTQVTRIIITTPLSMSSFTSCSRMPTITMAMAPAACAVVRPHMRCPEESGKRNCRHAR